MKLKRFDWGTRVSIAAAVAVVVIPVFAERLPGLKARWMLAQAANAVDFGQGDPQELLGRAVEQLDDPQQVCDYWHVRLKMALKEDPQKVVLLLVEARDSDCFNNLAGIAIEKMMDTQQFSAARDVTSLVVAKKKIANLYDLNQLAYLRALSAQELDQALEEVTLALSQDPDNFQFLDTRAWVLYKMGLLPEALGDADAAIKTIDAFLEQQENSFWMQLLKIVNGTTSPPKPSGDVLTRTEAGDVLWTAAVLRYHRAKILEGLGRTDQAEEDWSWLRARQLPTDDRLY